jgi:hypothetical protein
MNLGKNLLDGQIATAYLTGIVAETDRFSNEKTTPVVMSLSSTLMAAGANQQLISNELSALRLEPEVRYLTSLPAPDTGAQTKMSWPTTEHLPLVMLPTMQFTLMMWVI